MNYGKKTRDDKKPDQALATAVKLVRKILEQQKADLQLKQAVRLLRK